MSEIKNSTGVLVPVGRLVPESGSRVKIHLERLRAALQRVFTRAAVTRRPDSYPSPVNRHSLRAFFAGMTAMLAMQVGFSRLVNDEHTQTFAHNPVSMISTHSLAAEPSDTASIAEAEIVLNKPTTIGTTRSQLNELLVVDRWSPLGRDSSGINRDDALMLADRFLRGINGLHQHRSEAGFWLRHALQWTLPDASLTWALTQLGTILASPETSTPDYRQARTAWQVAAALGDPVATCFLAQTHEYGLGTSKNIHVANRLYRHAQALGGCPGLRQSTDALK